MERREREKGERARERERERERERDMISCASVGCLIVNDLGATARSPPIKDVLRVQVLHTKHLNETLVGLEGIKGLLQGT